MTASHPAPEQDHPAVAGAGTDPAPAGRSSRATWLSVVAVGIASLVLGVLTFHAQGALPEAWRSFANSASGWTLLTALLVLASRVRSRLAAALGALSFLLLVLGYTVAARLEGLSYSPVVFGVVALVVGPFIGLAAASLRDGGVRAALGTALLSGIFLGEAAYGLTAIADSTSPTYWVAIGALGGILLVWVLVARLRGWLPVVLAVGGTAVVAVMFVAAYTALGGF